MIQPCYYKGERGNKPYPLEIMLRLYLLQNLYGTDATSILPDHSELRDIKAQFSTRLKERTPKDAFLRVLSR